MGRRRGFIFAPSATAKPTGSSVQGRRSRARNVARPVPGNDARTGAGQARGCAGAGPEQVRPARRKAQRQGRCRTSSAKPTFGVMADDYVATHEGGWRNPKHRWQWTQTLTSYCAPIRDMPVDQIGTDDILAVLKPLWTRAPVTGSRLRGRIERDHRRGEGARPHRPGSSQPGALEGPPRTSSCPSPRSSPVGTTRRSPTPTRPRSCNGCARSRRATRRRWRWSS